MVGAGAALTSDWCSSPYFEMVFSEHPATQPVVVMPPDVKLEEMQHVLQFVYKGEVQVFTASVIVRSFLTCSTLPAR